MLFQKTCTLLFFVALSLTVQAKTFTFTGLGDYSTASNWLNAEKPTADINSGDVVIIQSGATCTFDQNVNLNGELRNYGTIFIDAYFYNKGYFYNENGGVVTMDNSASFRNHLFFYNQTGAEFTVSNTFHNYDRFYNSANANFFVKDYFYSYFEVHNSGFINNEGAFFNFNALQNYGSGVISNTHIFSNESRINNYGKIVNKSIFKNEQNGTFINIDGTFQNQSGATFNNDESAIFNQSLGNFIAEKNSNFNNLLQSIFICNDNFIASGTFNGDFELTSGGQLRPESDNFIGDFVINGSYTQDDGSSMFVDIASDKEIDLIHITGDATFGGTLEVKLFDGYVPKIPGTTYTISKVGTLSGQFSNLVLPDISANNLVWAIEYLETEVNLIAKAAIPIQVNNFAVIQDASKVNSTINNMPIAFPNPIQKHNGTLTLTGLEKGSASVRLFNTMGELINHYELGTDAIEIPVSQLATGVYHLEINQNGAIATQKIMVF